MPKIIVISGANGCGKTTVARILLPLLKIKEFVNADEIARGLSPLNPTGQAITAGRLVHQRIDELIAKGESFAIETTLSGISQFNKLKIAKSEGYVVEMHYIFSSDINLNIRRVKLRVEQGGHDVPAKDIRRRYWRSLKNFQMYNNICDKVAIYDTTEGRPIKFAERAEDKDFVILSDFYFVKFKNKLKEAVNGH